MDLVAIVLINGKQGGDCSLLCHVLGAHRRGEDVSKGEQSSLTLVKFCSHLSWSTLRQEDGTEEASLLSDFRNRGHRKSLYPISSISIVASRVSGTLYRVNSSNPPFVKILWLAKLSASTVPVICSTTVITPSSGSSPTGMVRASASNSISCLGKALQSSSQAWTNSVM
jgi:hypothetical protein